jgi:hypothetical protein
MRRLRVGTLAAISLLLGPAAVADDGWRLRPSVSLGGGGLFPSKEGQLRAQTQPAFQVEASLEYGPGFVAATLIRGIGEFFPEHSFVGGKLGYVLGDWPVSPYAAVAIGNLSQTAIFPFDEGTTGSASGLAYEIEIGAVLFRRAGLGRVWIYGLGLIPTFDVHSPTNAGTANIGVIGFGLRVGL